MKTDISIRLQKIREEKGLTIAELAEQTAIAADRIEAWESAKAHPNTEEFLLLAKLYDVSVDTLLFNDDEIPEYDENTTTNRTVAYKSKKQKRTIDWTSKWYSDFRKPVWHIFPAAALVIFICIGVMTAAWYPAWLILLVIPVYYGLVAWIRALGRGVDRAVADYMDSQKLDDK